MPAPRDDRLEDALIRARAKLVEGYQPCDREDRPLPPGEADLHASDARGYWVGELEADTTLESDYIIFLYFLDPQANREKIRKLARYISSKQLAEGGWNIYHGGPGELSASVKAYFALKLAGVPVEDPSMVRAREAIIGMGGAEKVNTFTKIYLSFLKQMDWEDLPAIPPEIVLLPRFFYFNIYEISYWSRAMLVPLSVLYARRPSREVPDGCSIDEIFARSRNGNGVDGAGGNEHGNGTEKGREGEGVAIPRDPNLFTWKNFFLLMDRLLKLMEKAPVKPLRGLALKTAERWMLSRLEKSDGLGAIFPAVVNSVMALRCLGYDESHPKIQVALEKLRRLEIEEGDAMRLQPCESPIWDTALAINALHEADLPGEDPRLVAAARWLIAKEVRTRGDWEVRNRGVKASGWYFQFQNEFYPDVDDTSAVLMALERAELGQVRHGLEAVRRGLAWVLSMQCRNGGWAAFDVDVDRQILTKVPFADHNAMLDPACADITGRMLEMLGRYVALRDDPRVISAIARAVKHLKDTQDRSGAWYGRWGVNYIYGTWQALKGLMAVGEDPRAPYIARAVRWLKERQNADGGWGESCLSYEDPSQKGIGPSTPSQTSWALMGLIACGETESPEVTRGVEFLISRQGPEGSWDEKEFTGTGFPRVFYLNYHLYRLYFPLFALASYRRAREGRTSVAPRKKLSLPRRRKRRRLLLARKASRQALRGILASLREPEAETRRSTGGDSPAP